MIDGIIVTQLKIIDIHDGDVMHAMTCDDNGFNGFGEAYFSKVEPGSIKAWKRHHDMVLNLIVPYGVIRFVMFDDRKDSVTYGLFQEVVLSLENYCRLTVPPMVWLGFQCLGDNIGMLLNLANIKHSPDESDRKNINELSFDWSNRK